MLPDLDASGDAAAEGSSPESGVDAALDAEATRPDAGVLFVPSHIYPDYTLTAPSVHITSDTIVDTSAGTITLNGAAPAALATMVHSGDVSVWSVGKLAIDSGVTLEVVGSRPLVVVSAGVVLIDGVFAVYSDRKRPGPGGAAPSSGAGKGADGIRPTSTVASGGGGAGHVTAGGAGGTQGAAAGGVEGPIVNANDALLVGGAGGGNGGGFAGNVCSDPTRGTGGFGGGALQISAVGKITISSTGVIDAGGGAGLGGCKEGLPDDHLTGGGGGGAGGLVVLESTTAIDLQLGGEIAAGGGGGGEGGSTLDHGADGESGLSQSASISAMGGTGNGGGAGGNGGYGTVGTANSPFGGFGGVVGTGGGGGGGSVGHLFLGSRAPSTPTVNGKVGAMRSDFAF